MRSPIRLVSISHGAEFEIDLSAFTEAEPVFAYADDVGAGVAALRGLVLDGRVTVPDRPPFLWLQGPRDCVRLRASADGVREGRASFRSLGAGEFCLEVYHLRPDGEAELLHANDFCFK